MNFCNLNTSVLFFILFALVIASCQKTHPTLTAGSPNVTPSRVVFSPDGKHMAAGIFGAVRVWNVKTEEFRDYPTKMKNETPRRISFSPDGKWIATGIFGAVRTWSISSGALRDYPMKLPNENPDFIAISPDGQTIATAAFGGVMKWKFEGFE